MNTEREHYLSTTFLVICLFMFVVSSRNAKAFRVSKLGERDPLYIYVFHPLFIIALPLVMHRMPNTLVRCVIL